MTLSTNCTWEKNSQSLVPCPCSVAYDTLNLLLLLLLNLCDEHWLYRYLANLWNYDCFIVDVVFGVFCVGHLAIQLIHDVN